MQETPIFCEEQPLADIVKDIVLPRVNREGMANIFVAVPQWEPPLALPDGMTATRKPIQGKRVAVRVKHNYGKFFTEEAVWIEDNLQSMRVPEFFGVLKYPVNIQVADYVLHCLPGHGILVPPGIPFTHRFEKAASPCEMLRMYPYHEGLLCWQVQHWRDAENQPQVREQACSIPHSQASSYLSDLVEEAVARHIHHEVVCDSLLKILFSLLHRDLQELPVLKTGVPFDDRPDHCSQMMHPINMAQEYMKRNLRAPLSIDDVARHAGMSRSVFTTQFRARTGLTFVRYLQNLRFNAACELLKGGDLRINQIAAAVGLKDDRMRVIFQEREGMSPSRYRKYYRSKRKNEAISH